MLPAGGVVGVCGVLAACGVLAILAGPASRQVDSFDVRLYDTGAASAAPLASEALTRKAGWRVVGKADPRHRFAGDAVVWNGQQALVLRQQARWAELYSITPDGPRLRASLACAAKGKAPTAGVKVSEIVKNTPAGVSLTMAFGSDPSASAMLTLARGPGLRLLTVRPPKTCTMHCTIPEVEHLLVPNYFGDDVLLWLHARSLSPGRQTRRVGLPAENFVLCPIRGGGAMVMPVWESRGLHASASFRRGASPDCCTQIECPAGRRVWLACLETPGIWHETKRDDSRPAFLTRWKKPCKAKWRSTRGNGQSLAVSWSDDKWAPTHKRLLPEADKRWRVAVTYPADRHSETPLDVFVVQDVLWATLGAGWCKYILAVEGLSGPGNPNPRAVMEWLERRLNRRRGRPTRDVVAPRLREMEAHIARVRKQIRRYQMLAQELNRVISTCKHDYLLAGPLLILSGACAQEAHAGLERGQADELAVLRSALLNALAQPDAAAQCAPAARKLREIEDLQNRTLAQCRMAICLTRQFADRFLHAKRAKFEPFVRKVRDTIDAFLRYGRLLYWLRSQLHALYVRSMTGLVRASRSAWGRARSVLPEP